MPNTKFQDLFAEMTWKEFEDYVIEILTRFYRGCGLQVHKTPYVNDGGKDGYASLLIAPPAISEIGKILSHETLFWAEVKKRTKDSVNEGDIGGHFILALDSYVHKLIFVTNGRFTERAKDTCTRVGRRLNLSVAFIDGVGLLQLADSLKISTNEIDRLSLPAQDNRADKQDYLSVRTGFISHHDHDLAFNEIFHIDPGEIIFWVCEISGICSIGTVAVEPIVATYSDSILLIHCLSNNIAQIDATETIQRIVFGVWANQPGEYDCKDILMELRVSNGMTAEYCTSNSILKVRHQILADTISYKREAFVDSINIEFDILSKNGGFRGCLLEAEGGSGKTFLINKIRQRLLKRGLREIYLDGAQHRVAAEVAQSLAQQSFPVPIDISVNIDQIALQQWISSNTPPGSPNDKIAMRLLSAVNGQIGVGHELHYMASALASTLSKSSNVSPILVVFEDLHKVSPSVLSLLEKLLAQLAVRKQGYVYFLFTTRPRAEGSKEKQTEWFKALGELCGNQGQLRNY